MMTGASLWATGQGITKEADHPYRGQEVSPFWNSSGRPNDLSNMDSAGSSLEWLSQVGVRKL